MAERVADYPCPPLLEPAPRELRIVFAGETIARTAHGWRVKETFPAQRRCQKGSKRLEWSAFPRKEADPECRRS